MPEPTTVRDFAQVIVDDWTPERRCQGALARGRTNRPTKLSSKYAVKWCILGEVSKFMDGNQNFYHELLTIVDHKLGRSVMVVNDSTLPGLGPDRVYEAIKEVAEGR